MQSVFRLVKDHGEMGLKNIRCYLFFPMGWKAVENQSIFFGGLKQRLIYLEAFKGLTAHFPFVFQTTGEKISVIWANALELKRGSLALFPGALPLDWWHACC